MDIKEIKQVIDLMKRYGLTEFELEEQAFKIRLRRDAHAGAGSKPGSTPPFMVETPMGLGLSGATGNVVPMHPAQISNGGAATAASLQGTVPPFPPANPTLDEPGVQIIKSPMVGTFYRTPNPEAKPFVDEGTVVQVDTVICIIEAMKLMNEIHAEIKGTITQVLAENGKPVEFGQPLFKVKVG